MLNATEATTHEGCTEHQHVCDAVVEEFTAVLMFMFIKRLYKHHLLHISGNKQQQF